MKKKSIVLYKKILDAVAEQSTCIRVKVAAIIVKNGRIISTGWNGVPSGKDHCEHVFNFHPALESGDTETFLNVHHVFATKNEIHAEQNVISYAARNGIKTSGADMFISISPCVNCTKLICAAGIKSVYYISEYDREQDGIEFLKANNIKCEKLK